MLGSSESANLGNMALRQATGLCLIMAIHTCGERRVWRVQSRFGLVEEALGGDVAYWRRVWGWVLCTRPLGSLFARVPGGLGADVTITGMRAPAGK